MCVIECVCVLPPSKPLLLCHHSDVLGAVTACWMVLVLGICNLYMSYRNLNFYKSWLQINNPEMISWICYLVRQKTHTHTVTVSVIFTHLPSLSVCLFISDPERIGSFCLVDSYKRLAGSGCSTQISQWRARPTCQHHRAGPRHRLHHHLVR